MAKSTFTQKKLATKVGLVYLILVFMFSLIIFDPVIKVHAANEKPEVIAAVSDGILTVNAVNGDNKITTITINGYEYSDIEDGSLNIRLEQFDTSYESFTVTAKDEKGNISDEYKIPNPYYATAGANGKEGQQLPNSATATDTSSATAVVTEHVKTDSDGNRVLTPAQQKEIEFAKADKEEREMETANAESSGSDSSGESKGKEFYQITTENGKIFYLIIDRQTNTEQVYFLTEISENDLLNVTDSNTETLPKNAATVNANTTESVVQSALPESEKVKEPTDDLNESSIDEPTSSEEEQSQTEESTSAPAKQSSGYIIIIIVAVLVLLAAYYFKIVKKKNNTDFVEDEEEEDDEEKDFFDSIDDDENSDNDEIKNDVDDVSDKEE